MFARLDFQGLDGFVAAKQETKYVSDRKHGALACICDP